MDMSTFLSLKNNEGTRPLRGQSHGPVHLVPIQDMDKPYGTHSVITCTQEWVSLDGWPQR